MQIIAIKPIIGLEIHRKVTGKPFECDDKLAQIYIEKGLAKLFSTHAQPEQTPNDIINQQIPVEFKTKRRRKK